MLKTKAKKKQHHVNAVILKINGYLDISFDNFCLRKCLLKVPTMQKHQICMWESMIQDIY